MFYFLALLVQDIVDLNHGIILEVHSKLSVLLSSTQITDTQLLSFSFNILAKITLLLAVYAKKMTKIIVVKIVVQPGVDDQKSHTLTRSKSCR